MWLNGEFDTRMEDVDSNSRQKLVYQSSRAGSLSCQNYPFHIFPETTTTGEPRKPGELWRNGYSLSGSSADG